MTDTRKRALYSNIIPASISGCFTFLISVTDGVIIGRGVSTAALGGVNIAVPFSDSEFYECRIEYDTAIYNDESINRFYDYFDEIAEKLANITDFSAVRALSIISK